MSELGKVTHGHLGARNGKLINPFCLWGVRLCLAQRLWGTGSLFFTPGASNLGSSTSPPTRMPRVCDQDMPGETKRQGVVQGQGRVQPKSSSCLSGIDPLFRNSPTNLRTGPRRVEANNHTLNAQRNLCWILRETLH